MATTGIVAIWPWLRYTFRHSLNSQRNLPLDQQGNLAGHKEGNALISNSAVAIMVRFFEMNEFIRPLSTNVMKPLKCAIATPNPHFSRPVRNAHRVPTFVGVRRESFRPDKPLATGDLLTNRRICEKVRLILPTRQPAKNHALQPAKRRLSGQVSNISKFSMRQVAPSCTIVKRAGVT